MTDVLQFNVGESASSNEGNGQLLKRFEVNLKFPMDRISAKREFTLMSHMNMMWGINSNHMDDPMKRILMRPPLGTIEKYVFKSEGMGMTGSSGGMMGGMGSSSTSEELPASGSEPSSTHSSHHGGNNEGGMTGHSGGMMGMSMIKRLVKFLNRRQINSMIGTNSNDLGNVIGRKVWNHMGNAQGRQSHHSGTMGGINGMMDPWSRVKALQKRQMMGGMMGGSGGSMHVMIKDGYWTHAMHLHLVVSEQSDISNRAHRTGHETRIPNEREPSEARWS